MRRIQIGSGWNQEQDPGSPDHFGQSADMPAGSHDDKTDAQDQEPGPGFFVVNIQHKPKLFDRQQDDGGNLEPDVQVIEPSRTGRIPGNHESRRQTYQPGIQHKPKLFDRQQDDGGNLEPDVQVIEPSRTGRIPGNHESRRQTYQPGTGSVPADKQCENQQTPENVQPQTVLLESRDVLGDRVCEKNRQPQQSQNKNLTHILKVYRFSSDFIKNQSNPRIYKYAPWKGGPMKDHVTVTGRSASVLTHILKVYRFSSDFIKNQSNPRIYKYAPWKGGPMKDHVTVTGRSASVLRIQVNEQEMFDETLLEQAAFDAGCLKCRVVCRNPVVLEYDISGLMDIQAFLQEYTFVQREGYGFLEELFESSIRTARGKPLHLDIRTVFCSRYGDQFRFAVLPLKTDAWLLQREEMRDFVEAVRSAFRTSTDYEIPGWLQMAQSSDQFSLPTVIQGLRELERTYHPRRFPFLPPKPREPFRTREEVQMAQSSDQFSLPTVIQGLRELERTYHPRRFPFLPPKPREPFRTREEVVLTVIEYDALMPPLPIPGSEKPDPGDRGAESAGNPAFTQATQILAPVPEAVACLVDGDSRYELPFETMTVGRGMQADIRVLDDSVSALHARITADQGRFYIQDLRSANGTWLGEKQVRRKMRLRNGMELRLGAHVLQFIQ